MCVYNVAYICSAQSRNAIALVQVAQVPFPHVQVWGAAAPVFTMTTVTLLEYSIFYYLSNMTLKIPLLLSIVPFFFE